MLARNHVLQRIFSVKKMCFRFETSSTPPAKSGGSLCGLCFPDSLTVDSSCRQPKVVIIGAGLAGLSAAERLVQCGIKDVTILEALSRPGGRVNTLQVDGSPFDLGACFVLGCCSGNSIYTLACQARGKDSRFERQPKDGTSLNFRGKASKSIINSAVRSIFQEIVMEARKQAISVPAEMDMWTFLSNEIEHICKYFPDADKEVARHSLYGMTNTIRLAFGTELTNVPVTKYVLKKRIPGGEMALSGGMSRILEPILKAIKGTNLKLNKAVKKILWSPKTVRGQSRAEIITCDKETITADYVISTMPLGVMKKSHLDMFEPHLPEQKVDSMNRIGLGHMNTVCLKYKKPFWFPTEGNISIRLEPEVIMKSEHWSHSIAKIYEMRNAPDVLKFVGTGNAAKQMECLTDQEIAEDVTMLMRCILGDPTIPMPSQVVRSKWSSDPHFLGALAYLGRDSSLRDLEEFGSPIPDEQPVPVLLFAGEATSTGHQGTMHGARLSGIREAERILRFTKCLCGPPPKTDKTCECTL